MSKIDENIIRLLGEYLTGEISENHYIELMSWLEEKASNRQFFESFCASRCFRQRWNRWEHIDPEIAISVFDRRTGKSPFVSYRRKRLTLATIAAVLVLAIGISFLYFRTESVSEREKVQAEIQPGSLKAMLILADGRKMDLEKQDSLPIYLENGIQLTKRENQLVYQGRQAEVLQYNELQIPRGGEYRVVLADGTAVQLNSASSLKYPIAFGKDRREVILSGEACFEVKKDTIPFLVKVGNLTIKVYGTTFNINTHIEDRIQIALLEGKVGITVTGGDQEYMLTPSHLADFEIHSEMMDINETDLTPYLAWTKGLFVFNNESMDRIMATLSLWYDMDVFYQNAAIQKLHFTGCVKRYDDIDQILRALSQSVGIKFTQQGKTLTISY